MVVSGVSLTSTHKTVTPNKTQNIDMPQEPLQSRRMSLAIARQMGRTPEINDLVHVTKPRGMPSTQYRVVSPGDDSRPTKFRRVETSMDEFANVKFPTMSDAIVPADPLEFEGTAHILIIDFVQNLLIPNKLNKLCPFAHTMNIWCTEISNDNNDISDIKCVVDEPINLARTIRDNAMLNASGTCKFSFVPLAVYYKAGGSGPWIGHWIGVIIDHHRKRVEVIDSNGHQKPYWNVQTACVELVKQRLMPMWGLTDGYEVQSIDQTGFPCRYAPQLHDAKGAGNCGPWMILYLWMRLKNPDLPMSDITLALLAKNKSDPLYIQRMMAAVQDTPKHPEEDPRKHERSMRSKVRRWDATFRVRKNTKFAGVLPY